MIEYAHAMENSVGVLKVNFSFNPNQSNLPNLPRLGMDMTLSMVLKMFPGTEKALKKIIGIGKLV